MKVSQVKQKKLGVFYAEGTVQRPGVHLGNGEKFTK